MTTDGAVVEMRVGEYPTLLGKSLETAPSGKRSDMKETLQNNCSPQLARDLRHAIDPVAFAVEKLGFTPDPWQVAVLRSTGRHILMNACRQSGKSTTAALMALHRAFFYPGSLVLLLSPSLRQSGELFRKVVAMLEALEPVPHRREDNRLSFTLANRSRVVSLPGSEETIRGFSSVSLLVEDEAARVDDALYAAIRPMLAVSGGRLVLLSTPFGKRGHFFEAWENGGDAWGRLRLTADQCPRISRAFLEEEKAALGEWWYRQEYFCEFVQTVDQVFDYGTVMGALSDEVRPLFPQEGR